MPYGVYIRTEEAKRNMSLAHIGKPNANRGKPQSEELRKKNSECHLGLHASEETRRRQSEVRKGRKLPPRSEESKEKQRLKMLGRHHSEETIKKMKMSSRRGKDNHAWNGGISFEPYGPEFNNTLKMEIRKRDDHTCQICRERKGKYVHHIDYNKKNNWPDNLISLCSKCHGKTTAGNRLEWEIRLKFYILAEYVIDKITTPSSKTSV